MTAVESIYPPYILPVGVNQFLDVGASAWVYKYLTEFLNVSFHERLVLSPTKLDRGAPVLISTKCSSFDQNNNMCDDFQCKEGGLWGLIESGTSPFRLLLGAVNSYSYPIQVFSISRIARVVGAQEWTMSLVEGIAKELKTILNLPDNYLDFVRALAKLTTLVVLLPRQEAPLREREGLPVHFDLVYSPPLPPFESYHMGIHLAEVVVESTSEPESYGVLYAEAREKFREMVVSSTLNSEVKDAVVNRCDDVFEVITEGCEFFRDMRNWEVERMAERAFQILSSILEGKEVECLEDTSAEVNWIVQKYIEGLKGPHTDE